MRGASTAFGLLAGVVSGVVVGLALGCSAGSQPAQDEGVFGEALPEPTTPEHNEPVVTPPLPQAPDAPVAVHVITPAPRPVASAPRPVAPPKPVAPSTGGGARARTGHVDVLGDAKSVVLLGDGVDVKYTGTSDVTPGAYKVKVWFKGDPVPQVATSVTVGAGEVVAVTCSSVRKWCREGRLDVPKADTGL